MPTSMNDYLERAVRKHGDVFVKLRDRVHGRVWAVSSIASEHWHGCLRALHIRAALEEPAAAGRPTMAPVAPRLSESAAPIRDENGEIAELSQKSRRLSLTGPRAKVSPAVGRSVLGGDLLDLSLRTERSWLTRTTHASFSRFAPQNSSTCRPHWPERFHRRWRR